MPSHTIDPARFLDYGPSRSVSDAVVSRRSLRAFLPTEVPRDLIEELLTLAARAPSGTNMQPWHAWVLMGEKRDALCEAVCASFDRTDESHDSEVRYYPEEWFDPYKARRRKVGWDLYGLLGIEKGERERMHTQHRKNFTFFDAPVGLIFTIDRRLATGSWLDYGMFLQNIMLLAREHGLHTCPQAAWADHHPVIREQLALPPEHVVVCGMALGYADPDAIENTLVTERAPLEDWVKFV